MELRVRGERAVLAGRVGTRTEEVDPHSLALGGDLADDLHEWAKVASAVQRMRERATGVEDGAETALVVSQRGRQLAGRVAAAMGTAVRYVDPVTEVASLVPPPGLRERARAESEPTPWATGLTVAAFIAVVAIVAMLALVTTLASETSGWVALLAAVVVSAGLAPSLWLGRRLPVLRWVALGAAGGLALSWIGVLVVVF
ncbi:DUF2537 domain-containing protein [Amycolatopsis suaedae]|uniref:DUF2537 domain-containing protein n=1 Tax=Amycolatopsis suaedae TaxID=2510978 RepID=A0A4Q7J4D9_9PSEU|nr:DUF2537 domain-containing protein [Amycolatopsis suaedae]RZQ61889.1 DUF2537 domain-containing protein [Amycolatopsis suaedae]